MLENDAPASVGVLYLVATPIGNLEDITARALRVLREADVIAAEDTRVTRKLLAHFDIHTPLTAYHAHTTEERASALLDRLASGAKVALVSDAGTPCVSDPGTELVTQALSQGIRVESVPGPSALLAALVASGLPTARFVFEGFLPRTRSEYTARLEIIARETRTTVLYEAPLRVVETLADLCKVCGKERRIVAAREITKKFEEFQRGTLEEIATHFATQAPRGEFVLVLEGAPDAGDSQEDTADPETLLRAALERGESPRDAARAVARVTGLPRNDVYAIVLRISAEL